LPRKIRQLVKDLEKAGFDFVPGKGGHRKFVHAKVVVVVIFGRLGDAAHRYQEKAVAEAIRKSK
jgi:predicted RNA binding protein YcfA (HicA-like mRNA interferase family)